MITINKITGRNELHCHYDRQTNAQPCYIELDCKTGDLRASYNGEIGNAIPFAVYHGHRQRWGIPCLIASEANALMQDIEPLAERVIAGYTSEWDGSNNVAIFSDDAKSAIDEITDICDDIDNDELTCVQEWDADQYLSDVTYHHDTYVIIGSHSREIKITAETTDDQLSDIEDLIESEAENNIVINQLDKYLTDLRDECEPETEAE